MRHAAKRPASAAACRLPAIDGERRRFAGGLGIGIASALGARLLAAAVLPLAGCATRPAGNGPAALLRRSSEALGRLEAGGPGRLAVGTVQPADDERPATAFADALGDALVADLRAIGVLDAHARTLLDVLTGWRGDAVEAQVTLTRAGQVRLKKRYRTPAYGAAPVSRVVVPPGDGRRTAASVNNPPAVSPDASNAVRLLLDELYDDPEFNLAIKD